MTQPELDVPGPDTAQAHRKLAYPTNLPHPAFWMAGAALLASAVAIGPLLFRGAPASVTDRIVVALWAFLALLTIPDLIIARRAGMHRTWSIAMATSGAGALCMLIAQVTSNDAVTITFMAAAAVFLVAQIVAVRRFKRTLLAPRPRPST
jgi:hypothetical protein